MMDGTIKQPERDPHDQGAGDLLLSAPVNRYLEQLFSLQRVRSGTFGDVLDEMESLAKEKGFPIIGPLVGPCLRHLVLLSGAKRIFEFGSGFGYSAVWFASAFTGKGKVICTEGDASNIKLAEGFLKKARLWDKIEYHQGWAQDVFKTQNGQFDLIYNDADKGDYPEIWELAQNKLKSGGLYVADNCLWAGRVAMNKVTNDVKEGWTEAIKAHNHAIVSHPDFESFLNPARDGVLIARRR